MRNPKTRERCPVCLYVFEGDGTFQQFFWVSVCGWGRRRKRGTLYVLRAERSQDSVLTQGLGGDADRRTRTVYVGRGCAAQKGQQETLARAQSANIWVGVGLGSAKGVLSFSVSLAGAKG